MNISRFFGATNREAMRQVRLALGPDALIISNKRINGGVEILATDQTPESPPVAGAPAAPIPPAPSARPAAAVRPAVPPQEQDVVGAIGELRGSLESRIDELLWGNQLRRAPAAVMLFQTLLRFGFSTALLRAMLKRLPEHLGERAAFQWARGELVKHLPVLATEEALWRPGLVLALVGPTGVGKTTTIAKLAARCVRRAGPGSLVLVTTDTYRIGAHEQLKIYGQMLHVPVHVVQDIHEMRRVVQGVRDDQTVLIDNVGISQRDQALPEQAALLAGAGRDVSRLLVLNASSHGDTLDEVARSYAGDGGTPLRGCIITKLDEASRLGAALDTAIRYQLPIHYVSNGQKVPEHLLFLSAAALVDHALAPAQGGRTLYAPTEADLAALLSMTRPVEDPEEAAAAQRRKALLPRLLTLSAHGGETLADEDLRAAVAALDEDPVLSEGYTLWRIRGTAGAPRVAEGVGRLRGAARRELAEPDASALAVHGRIPVRPGAGAAPGSPAPAAASTAAYWRRPPSSGCWPRAGIPRPARIGRPCLRRPTPCWRRSMPNPVRPPAPYCMSSKGERPHYGGHWNREGWPGSRSAAPAPGSTRTASRPRCRPPAAAWTSSPWPPRRSPTGRPSPAWTMHTSPYGWAWVRSACIHAVARLLPCVRSVCGPSIAATAASCAAGMPWPRYAGPRIPPSWRAPWPRASIARRHGAWPRRRSRTPMAGPTPCWTTVSRRPNWAWRRGACGATRAWRAAPRCALACSARTHCGLRRPLRRWSSSTP